ncbi:MAG: SpoIID/LytB domain-containing protein [Planctomycetota bacterium]
MRRLSALSALALCACALPPSRSNGAYERGALRASAPLAPPVQAAPLEPERLAFPTTVRVRLEAVQRRALVEVVLADGHPITVRRVGDDVVASTGQRGRSVTLTAPTDGALRLGGNAYPGALTFSAHPASGLAVYNEAPLEGYVAGVVASELSIWSAPPAELEAQAIAARTYALGQLSHRARERALVELVDGVQDQAYRGLYQANNASTRAIAERLDAAVRATHGMVLMRGDQLEEARFHASCGGHTASFADIFTEPGFDPGPTGAPCPPCQERAQREAAAGQPDAKRPLGWRVTVPHEALARAGKALGLGGAILAVAPKRLDASGRWLDAQVRGPKGLTVIPYDDLRRALGYGVVKGARLVRAVPAFGQPIRSGLVLEGLGRGHGVGLCQEGARDLARDGWSAEQILALYYPGARIERASEGRAIHAAARR